MRGRSGSLYTSPYRTAAASHGLGMMVLVALCGGCDRAPDRFAVNVPFARNQKLATSAAAFATPPIRQRLDDIDRAVALHFGTPREPVVPVVEGLDVAALFDLAHLQRAAGAVPGEESASEPGLYHRLCARCHGTEGSGQGPEAHRLDPYPRDYRPGLFKLKSTASTHPPTDADLHRVLRRGIPGTAMPSFERLADVERAALVQYVRYLSIRGQFERAVIAEIAWDFDDDDRLLDPRAKEIRPTLYERQLRMLDTILMDVATPWLEVDEQVVSVPPPPKDFGTPPSVARGREMFFLTLTNCGKCHGDTALGDGQTDDYDEWTKEIEPTNFAALGDYLALGALPPRTSQPRNLRVAEYRGGERPEDLFVRIKYGIAGTTMPNIALQLSDADTWHLVAYALYLPMDPLSVSDRGAGQAK